MSVQSCEDSLREDRLTGTVASNPGRTVSGTACISFGEKDCPRTQEPLFPERQGVCHLTWWPLIKQDFAHFGCVHGPLVLIGLWS